MSQCRECGKGSLGSQRLNEDKPTAPLQFLACADHIVELEKRVKRQISKSVFDPWEGEES